MAQEISDLIVYCKSNGLSDEALEAINVYANDPNGGCENLCSLNEIKAKNMMITSNRKQFQLFHQKYLTRIYPKVTLGNQLMQQLKQNDKFHNKCCSPRVLGQNLQTTIQFLTGCLEPSWSAWISSLLTKSCKSIKAGFSEIATVGMS